MYQKILTQGTRRLSPRRRGVSLPECAGRRVLQAPPGQELLQDLRLGNAVPWCSQYRTRVRSADHECALTDFVVWGKEDKKAVEGFIPIGLIVETVVGEPGSPANGRPFAIVEERCRACLAAEQKQHVVMKAYAQVLNIETTEEDAKNWVLAVNFIMEVRR
jgi:hypothetical protein